MVQQMGSHMAKTVTYSKPAAKVLRGLPANLVRTIDGKMQQYASNPASLVNNVIKMQGRREYMRLRVGDWRVIFTEDAVVINVVKIDTRGGVYKD